ncbi:hypothetical protein AOLI_G00124670 [Acnodon oligacanthus]
MDAVSVHSERDEDEIKASSTEGPALSEIPKLSLCPPDSEDPESPTNQSTIERDHINNLSRPPSSSQLYDKVSQSCAYQSPQLKRCPCCGHNQPITGNVCLNQTNAPSHSDCSSNAVKTVHRCSPFHQPMCHNTMQCHWLQGSRDGSNYKPVQHHVVTVRTERLHRIPKSYSQVIVEYPMTVLISCMVVLLIFSLVGILTGPLPDFSDPLLGFEPRGTDIGIRTAAWTKLQESTGPGKALSLTSQQSADKSTARDFTSRAQHHLKHRLRRMLHRDSTENTFFCNAPGDHYAQLVFRSGNSASLWSLKAIYSMCEMERTQLRSDAYFEELCQVKSETAGSKVKRECCPSWSLGNALALLNNVSSCFSLTAQQVTDSLNLLRYCASYYHDGSLVASCAERSKYGYCASVPLDCKRSSIIYQILHYLVDKDFLGPQTVEYQVPSLKYSVLFLPVAKGDALMAMYLEHLEGNELTYNNITITGMDLGIKQKLFKFYLSRDSVYPILTVLALLITMALYLKSLLLSVMSLAAVTLSLLTSYFFYKFRYIWICWFAVLAAGGIYISCVDPGMKLPSSDSRATQLFRSSHPFERYDAEYRHQFMFERLKQGEDEPMTLTLIWGVIPTDDADHFNPKGNGSFAMDPEFNMTSSEAQQWLRELCGKIRNQSFYSPSPAEHEAVEDNACFVEDLIHWVSLRRCSESADAFSFCCNNISFPYHPNVFEQCLKMMVAEQQAARRSPRNGGLRFDSHSQVAALVIVFKTSQLYSFNFSRMSHFYSQIVSWFNKEIAGAPPGLQKGWFSLCCFFGPEKNCGKIIIPCATERATENMPSSCSTAEPGTTNPSANGAFGCGTGSRGRRSFNKEGGGGFLCPNQQRHRHQQAGLRREPEQYELQPLACHLSDSFENSTCTSKLSNRPSVLSDDIEFCGLSPKRDYDRISMEADSEEMSSRHLKGCNPPPALQTSSPYKGNVLRPVVVPPGDPAKEKLLCKKCRGQSVAGVKMWTASLSSSSSMDDIMVTETTCNVNKRSLSMDGATTCHPHKRLSSYQSQSSFEGLEDSNETCLSDIEPAVSVPPSTVNEGELRPGHLNGKRDTLRLSLRETVYDLASPGTGRGRTSQSEPPVILPNSKPDMPDVWIKRDGRGEDSS